MVAQVEAAYVEALSRGAVAAQVEAAYVEALARGPIAAQVEAAYVEALSPLLLEQVVANSYGWGVRVKPAKHPALLAAWRLNENAGTAAADASGNGRTLTVQPSSWTGSGHSGAAILGDGTASRGGFAPWPSVSLSAVTLMAWFYPTDLTSGSTRPIFGTFDAADAGGSTQLALWAQRGDFGTTNVLQGNVRTTSTLGAVYGSALTVNTWQHVALTHDGTTARVFLNGVQAGSASIATAVPSGAHHVVVLNSPSSATNYGRVDDVRIYSAALSAAEILAESAN